MGPVNQTVENLRKSLRTEPPSVEWAKCRPQSDGVIANLFVIFKTPMSAKKVEAEYRFSPKMLLNSFRIQGQKIGLWIDTLDKNDFYDPEEVRKLGTTYCDLPCAGESAENELVRVPSSSVQSQFNNLCKNFLQSRSNEFEYIGVHCSLGFNMSGYLIVSFMVQRMNFTLEGALDALKARRPYGISNQTLLDDLYAKYGSGPGMGLALAPKWMSQKNRNKIKTGFAKFVRGMENTVEVVTDLEKLVKLQKKVHRLCNWTRGGFAGRTVVTLDPDNIGLLKEKPYRVTPKADGRRFMLFIQGPGEFYFVDRENYFFRLVKKNNSEISPASENESHLKDTLIDTEVIMDNKGQPMVIMFDLLAYQGENKMQWNFDRRYKLLRDILARTEQDQNYFYQLSSFRVILGPYHHLSSGLKEFLDENFNTDYETDGLIFQPADEPYFCGACDFTMKWKPSELSTVDFLLKISGNGTGFLYVLGLDPPLGQIELTPKLEQLDGKIIECCFQDSKWNFLRLREERISPNTYNTAMEVIGSILDPITKEELMKYG